MSGYVLRSLAIRACVSVLETSFPNGHIISCGAGAFFKKISVLEKKWGSVNFLVLV